MMVYSNCNSWGRERESEAHCCWYLGWHQYHFLHQSDPILHLYLWRPTWGSISVWVLERIVSWLPTVNLYWWPKYRRQTADQRIRNEGEQENSGTKFRLKGFVEKWFSNQLIETFIFTNVKVNVLEVIFSSTEV